MPGAVLDELRGRYSKFRTRYAEAFEERLEKQAREKEERERRWKADGEGMLGGALRELSLRDRGQEGVRPEVPETRVLELLGRRMVERGVRGSVGAVADARERDLKSERRRGRLESRGYWPTKGWKERQRGGVEMELMAEREAEAARDETVP